ncbi:MAG TPA: hypothetical protein PLH12_04925 [Pseudomonadales bacterium]|nr:hypothetical protein [Pseudomonadales bacterium]
MRKLKKIILAILPASFCYAFWWCAMNYAGYCHAEGRFLSDQEKIYSAVKYVMPHSYPRTIKRQRNISINGVIGKSDYLYENKKPIKYKDEQDFLALNPDCCTLSMKIGEIGEIERPAIIDRVTGYFSTYVTVRFKIRFLDENNKESFGEGSSSVSVTNCGKSWSRF